MAQATFFEQKAFSPTSLTMVIGIHVALIAAAVAWKIDVILPEKPIDTIIFNVDTPKPPAEPPKPRPEQAQTEVAQTNPPVSIVDLGQVIEEPPVTVINKPVVFVSPEPPIVIDPPVRIEQSAAARGNVQALIRDTDYPDTARRNEETGTVRARLDIGETGKVTGCTVIASSGSSALDSATCRILKARARFTPAKDSNGQAVADSYTTPKITWRLEGAG